MTTGTLQMLRYEVDFTEYLRWPELSQSTLKRGRDSMAHLRAAWDDELVMEPTDDMVLGSALHTTFLEPEHAATRIAVWANGVRRGAAWDGFCMEHAGKYILTSNQHVRLVGMVKSLRKHPEVRKWLSKIEAVEVSTTGTLQSINMKGRVDALTADPLIDLKKVCDGDPRNFARQAYDFGYHIQAHVYSSLFQRDRFILMTVEDQPPYDVVPYELSDEYMRRGEMETNDLLAKVVECLASGVWPGRTSKVETLREPSWIMPLEQELKIS